MDAFMVARELLGEMALSPEQLAQLRVINHDYAQQLFTLMRSPAAPDRGAHPEVPSPAPRTGRDLMPVEAAELRRTLEAAGLGLLTPEQGRLLQRS